MKNIKKALTFRASSLGDCLMAKYLLDNVHVQFPNARLAIVVASRTSMIRDLLTDYPYIEVVEANRRSLSSLWRLWQNWRGSDLVVTQYGGKAGGSFGLASKLAARALARRGGLVGFADAASGWNATLYDHLVPDTNAHSPAENERRALRAAGLAISIPYPMLVPPRGEGALQKFALTKEKYIIVHLFSGSKARGMHPSKRRELVSLLRAALPKDVQLVVTGSKTERVEAQAAAGEDARVIAGEASLQDMFELVGHAASTVSLDTGVAHVAAQMHRPVYVVSTCMGMWWWNEEQYGKNATFEVFTNPLHSIAEHEFVDYPSCLNDIDLHAVAASVGSELKHVSKRAAHTAFGA